LLLTAPWRFLVIAANVHNVVINVTRHQQIVLLMDCLHTTRLDCLRLGDRVELAWVFAAPVRPRLPDRRSLRTHIQTLVDLEGDFAAVLLVEGLDDQRLLRLLADPMRNFSALFSHSRRHDLLYLLKFLDFVHVVLNGALLI
jgi:hypothetical protein